MKIIETKEGWSVIEGDLISNWVISTGKLDHDNYLPALACQYIPEGGLVFDCGGNIGTHTVAYARKVGKRGTVIAIEAGKTAFECLNKNAAKFECEVVLIQAALSDVHGAWLTHLIDEKNIGGSRIVEFQPKGDKVWTVSIDSLVKEANIKRCDFIKIDCEGMELKILNGALNVMKTLKPKFMIEMNSGRLKENGASYDDVYKFLKDNKYEYSKPVQPECSVNDPQYDIIAMPI